MSTAAPSSTAPPAAAPAAPDTQPIQGDAPPASATGGNADRGGQPDEEPLEGDANARHKRQSPDDDIEMAEDDEGAPKDTSPKKKVTDPHLSDSQSDVGSTADAPRVGAARVSTAVTGLLSFEETMGHIRAGVLPRRHVGPQQFKNISPTRFTTPPKHTPGGRAFIVGVPANARAYREGAYVRDGYAGLEALMQFEGLSDQDLHNLGELLGNESNVRENFLRPYVHESPPDVGTLENVLNSLMLRREMASIVTQFSPDRLAERVFHTVSILHRVLIRYRAMQARVQGLNDSAAQKSLEMHSKYVQLQSEYCFLNEYYESELKSVRDTAATTKANLEADFKRLAQEHLDAEQAAKKQNQELETELMYAKAKINQLERVVKEKSFDADTLLAFLNEGHNEVRNNWPRFRRVLKCFQRGVKPPASWKTWVQVEAVDQAFKMIPPYPGPAPSYSEDDNDDDQEEKRDDSPADDVIDLAGGDSSSEQQSPSKKFTPKSNSSSKQPSSKSSRRGSKVSSEPMPKEPQLRPSVRVQCDVKPRSPLSPLMLTEDEACILLPDFVAWQDLRWDVQLCMRTGVGYKAAMAQMSEDRVAHGLFHRDPLIKMLATMMAWHKLDETPWTKYVPESYFQIAELVLVSFKGENLPASWPALGEDDATVLSEASDESEEPDNAETDPDYAATFDEQKNKTYQRKSPRKHSRSEDNQDTEDNSEDDVRIPGSAAKAKRAEHDLDTDSSSSKSGATPKKSSSPTTPQGTRTSPRLSKLDPSPPKKLSRRQEGIRLKSPLARKRYDDLTIPELAGIEQPARGVLSWRVRGILTHFSPRKDKHEEQTLGFHDYTPQKLEVYLLSDRFQESPYVALLQLKPWEAMFKERVKVLYFHRRSELSANALTCLDEWMTFVFENLQAFWEVLHWIIIQTKLKAGDVVTLIESAVQLHKERGLRHEAVGRTVDKRMQRLIARGMPATLFYEPGVWKYPAKVCHWYLMHSSMVKDDGTAYSLGEQLDLLESQEPCRTQWSQHCTVEQRVQHLPPEIKAKLLSPEERADNWVTTKFD